MTAAEHAELESLRARITVTEAMVRDHLIGDDVPANTLGKSLLRALNPEALEMK